MDRIAARQQTIEQFRSLAQEDGGASMQGSVELPCECSATCQASLRIGKRQAFLSLDEETRIVTAAHSQERPQIEQGEGWMITLADGVSPYPDPDAEPAFVVAQLILICGMAGLDVVPRLRVVDRDKPPASVSSRGRGCVTVSTALVELTRAEPSVVIASILGHEIAHIEQKRRIGVTSPDEKVIELLADKRACDLLGTTEGILRMVELTAHYMPDGWADTRLEAAGAWQPAFDQSGHALGVDSYIIDAARKHQAIDYPGVDI